MRDWIFEMTKSGELVPYQPPALPGEGEDTDEYIKRIGFKADADYIGDRDTDNLEWHENSKAAGHEYLAFWNDVNTGRMIFVPDWPTLVKLQALATPIIHAKISDYRLSELQVMAEKAFRVLHNHDPHGACRQCDPQEAERIAQYREERARAKRGEVPGQGR